MKKYNAIIILGILAFIVLLPNIWDNSNSTEARINSEQAWSNLSESDYELARHNKMAKSLFESLRQIIEPGQTVHVVMAEVPKTDGRSGDVYYKTNIPEEKLRQYAR